MQGVDLGSSYILLTRAPPRSGSQELEEPQRWGCPGPEGRLGAPGRIFGWGRGGHTSAPTRCHAGQPWQGSEAGAGEAREEPGAAGSTKWGRAAPLPPFALGFH